MKIRIFAPSRSGHHAFMNWLAHQINEPTIHYNNCLKGWENQKLIPLTGKTTKFGKAPYKHEIYSIEYFNLNDYSKYKFDEWDDEYIDILFLRDYFNWIASSLKNGENRFSNEWTNRRGDTEMPVIKLWEQYANEFIDPKILTSENTHFVSYNKWCDSEEYRKEIAESLGLTFTDKGINVVPHYGGGSSYDGMNLQGKGKNLQTSTRWEKHKNDEHYLRLIDNKACIELNNKLFDMELVSIKPLMIK